MLLHREREVSSLKNEPAASNVLDSGKELNDNRTGNE